MQIVLSRLNLKYLEKDQSAFLDCLRGMAAVFVMAHHLKNTFFVAYSSLDKSYTANPLVTTFYFLTGFGDIPVLLFFVLSGFFISRSIFKMLREERWSKEKYLIERLTRLELVLIPALFLTAFWDNISKLIAPVSGLIATNNGDASLGAFLENSLFLQTIFCQTFGSNYPLWSLSFEFWYYMIFPLALFILMRARSKKIQSREIAILTVIILTLIAKNIGILQYFLIWLLGVIPILLPTPKRSKLTAFILGQYKIISLILIGLALILFRKDPGDSFFKEFVIACVFSLVVYLTINSPLNTNSGGVKVLFNSFSVKLAAFSYTLYLVHAPIIDFFINFSAANGFGVKWEPSPIHLVVYSILAAIVIIYAIAIARLTEFNTNKVRNLILARFLQPSR
jgi:peptidoglycan/LPS O-acetylase OafA/YrhL